MSISCSCGDRFRNGYELARHRTDGAGGRYLCMICQRCCGTTYALRQHQREAHPLCSCGQCGRGFMTAGDLAQHQEATNHSPSGGGGGGLTVVSLTAQDADDFCCRYCDRAFADADALQQHLVYKPHQRLPICSEGGPKRFYCRKCKRYFRRARDLRQHKASSVHRPVSKIRCVAYQIGCNALFPSPSALLHHLGSGICPSGIDRELLNAMTIANDIGLTITKISNIIQNALGGPTTTTTTTGLSSPGTSTPAAGGGGGGAAALSTPSSSEAGLPQLAITQHPLWPHSPGIMPRSTA